MLGTAVAGLFFYSCAMRGMFVRAVIVQGRADAQKKLEGVTEIVAVVCGFKTEGNEDNEEVSA